MDENEIKTLEKNIFNAKKIISEALVSKEVPIDIASYAMIDMILVIMDVQGIDMHAFFQDLVTDFYLEKNSKESHIPL